MEKNFSPIFSLIFIIFHWKVPINCSNFSPTNFYLIKKKFFRFSLQLTIILQKLSARPGRGYKKKAQSKIPRNSTPDLLRECKKIASILLSTARNRPCQLVCLSLVRALQSLVSYQFLSTLEIRDITDSVGFSGARLRRQRFESGLFRNRERKNFWSQWNWILAFRELVFSLSVSFLICSCTYGSLTFIIDSHLVFISALFIIV